MAAKTSRESRAYSDIETEFDHIAIAHHVLVALEAQFAALARLGHGTEGDEIVIMDSLRRDEPALEVGVDLAGGYGRRISCVDGPRRLSFSPVVRYVLRPRRW